jgi:branched-chain amino acid transport system ATP-binding protein
VVELSIQSFSWQGTRNVDGGGEMSSPMATLKANHVTKKFGAFTALDEVDLRVESHELHSIIGPNGAGKTTLFDVFTGVLQPTEGAVEIDDTDLTGVPVYDRVLEGIARSYQVTNVFQDLTVRDNLMTAVTAYEYEFYSVSVNPRSNSDVQQRVDEVIEDIGLEAEQATRAANLSHGDARRLEIGMALASKPRVLLLDEPTAGMGREEILNTTELITKLGSDKTVIIIEHNIEVIMEISDRITVLNKGEVIAQGPPEDIRTDEHVNEVYLAGGIDA